MFRHLSLCSRTGMKEQVCEEMVPGRGTQSVFFGSLQAPPRHDVCVAWLSPSMGKPMSNQKVQLAAAILAPDASHGTRCSQSPHTARRSGPASSLSNCRITQRLPSPDRRPTHSGENEAEDLKPPSVAVQAEQAPPRKTHSSSGI